MRMKKLFAALVVILLLLSFGSRVPSEGGYGLFAPIQLQLQKEKMISDNEQNIQEEVEELNRRLEKYQKDMEDLEAKSSEETPKFGGIIGDSYSESLTGYCTGDYVRVREEPLTNAEIFGRVHKGDKVIVVGKSYSSNQFWYEIKNPFGNGTAYISANYVQISDNASGQRSVPVNTANSEIPKFGGIIGDETDRTARTNSVRITSTASSQNGYDVPDFFALNDGNLRAVNKERKIYRTDDTVPHKRYEYECDMHKYDNYIERYIQQLSSYNFNLTTHYVDDYRRVAHKVNILESETWVLSYNGSKQVRKFKHLNLKAPKYPHITPFVISKYVYHHEGVTRIYIRIADELTYAGENAFVNNVNSVQTRQSNSDSSSYSSSSGTADIRHPCFSCNGSGTVDCSVCGGDGGKYEYDSSTPNYAGRTDPLYYASKRVWVPCRNFNCRNGKVECSRCNGTGYTN